MFIELTPKHLHGKKGLVNLNKVESIGIADDGTASLYYADGAECDVAESYERVKQMIMAWQTPQTVSSGSINAAIGMIPFRSSNETPS